MQGCEAMTAKVVSRGWRDKWAAFINVGTAPRASARWFAATARPAVRRGNRRFSAPAFGRSTRRGARTYVALLVQAARSRAVHLLAGRQCRFTARYDALVQHGPHCLLHPVLYMFAAMIVLQRRSRPVDVMRVPGGKPVAVAAGSQDSP